MTSFSLFGFCSLQLATLGACQCRGKNQEPCACARAAVDAKREVAKLNNEVKNKGFSGMNQHIKWVTCNVM